MELTDNQILNYAVNSGIIDLAIISQRAEENMRMKYLEKHDGDVWKGDNGSWYTYVHKEDGTRKLLRKSTKKALDEAIIAHYRHEADSFGDVFWRWMRFKMDHNEITKQSYDRYVATFDKYFGDFKKKIFCEITERELESFIRDTIAEYNMTAKMWSNLRTVILGVFSHGKYETDISISQFMSDLKLAPKVFRKKYKGDEEEIFDHVELRSIEALIMEKPDIVGYAILLAMRTGLRSGELSALKWCDITDDVMLVRRTEIRYKEEYVENNKKKERFVYDIQEFTKGAKGYRRVVLTQDDVDFIKKIRALNPFGEYVFMNNGKRIHTRCIASKLYRICDKLNIPRRSMHKLRKTYATSLINAKIPTSIIKEQMGHTDLRTTLEYYYRENHTHDEVKASIELARENAI